jgi:hypothetical protein
MGPQSPAEVLSHPTNQGGDTSGLEQGAPARELMKLLAPSTSTEQR